MEKYPVDATERFDNANFHIKYCLTLIKKYIQGDILEVGAGCGSFTRNYYNQKINNILNLIQDHLGFFLHFHIKTIVYHSLQMLFY